MGLPPDTGHAVSEIVTLTRLPADFALAEVLESVLGQLKDRARLEAGQDSAGNFRVVVTLTGQDAAEVAEARQTLLRACRAAGIRAFVI